MIEIKINATTALEARQLMSELLGGVAPAPAVAPAAKAETPAKAEPKKTEPKKAEPKADPTPAPAEPATSAAEPEQPSTPPATAGSATPAELDYDKDVTPAVLAVAQKLGREGVMSLLAKFGATNAKDVAKDRWPELIADANALLVV